MGCWSEGFAKIEGGGQITRTYSPFFHYGDKMAVSLGQRQVFRTRTSNLVLLPQLLQLSDSFTILRPSSEADESFAHAPHSVDIFSHYMISMSLKLHDAFQLMPLALPALDYPLTSLINPSCCHHSGNVAVPFLPGDLSLAPNLRNALSLVLGLLLGDLFAFRVQLMLCSM